ncbi:hypothetical protein AS194_04905 [Psychrobacter piscatorii]|uniref:Uncharacterized protein n=1 Tax=Psychrobacter piscatorii TaxID=554343 RepID=A0A0T6DUG5_9GAMM|nr:hypothetical protein AS194_04905 [Psychrobacter piscatorii]
MSGVSSSNIANMAILEQSKVISERTLTKREQIAAMCLQGFLSTCESVQEHEADKFCSLSVLIADKLINKLERKAND